MKRIATLHPAYKRLGMGCCSALPYLVSNMDKAKMATLDVTAVAAKNRTDTEEIGVYTL